MPYPSGSPLGGQPQPDPDAGEDEERAAVQRLLAHRTLGLLDLSFSLADTLRLARRADVVHDAERLLRQGASHAFVVDELADSPE